ncbi:recombinase family protein [Mycobacterium colombiense]|uniref:recombinase family protein n=1 Tax=Mycobacterium colombiense TaxID=339268 RepID=UPI00200A1897|nr:recombinase family protein [Mycobacterium colombiense]MCK8645634.1 recombinase family protein [Mycobacterium colombiense]
MKTAVYLRQSLDRTGNELAVDRQREQCANLAQRRGWIDIAYYVDNDTSASTGTRPAYRQMLADIESGAIGAVVCYHLDRLHRQPRELEDFIELADKRRIALATVTGEVDLGTDNGRLIARITGAVAKAEVERKSARQKSANRQRAAAGNAWRERSFGYDGNSLVLDEAKAIHDGCTALLGGASLYGIAQQWNSAGLKTVRGSNWTGTTVRQMLMRPRNAGLAVYGGDIPRADNGTRLATWNGSACILEGVETDWPAIISRDTYDAVCAVLANPKRLTGKSPGRVNLLTGLAICGHCKKPIGSGLVRTKRAGVKRPVYTCKHCRKITRDMASVDQKVIDVITARLARPDAAKVFARPTVDTKALTAEADKYRALIAAAEADYDNGDIDAKRMNARISMIQPKLDAVTVQLLGSSTSRVLDGLVGEPDAAERFDKLPLDRKRAVIDTIATVTIDPATYAGEAFNPNCIRVERKSA